MMIIDRDGNVMADGVHALEVDRVAQQIANQRQETVYVSTNDGHAEYAVHPDVDRNSESNISGNKSDESRDTD